MEGKFDIFAVIGMRMDRLGQRQKVVADKIANTDAPNYREGEAPRRSRGPPHADLGGGPKNGRAIRRAKGADQAAFRVAHSRGRGGPRRSGGREPAGRAVPRGSERPWADPGNRAGAGAGSLKRNGRLWFKP